MPIVGDTSRVGALGVTIAQYAVESELGWIFRRVEHRDTGIDAQIEPVIFRQATGLLLGLQIKSGASYFREPIKAGWRFRGDRDHLDYWQGHSHAVVVVLVDVDSGTAYWASVGEGSAVKKTKRGWTVVVPRDQVVSAASRQSWFNLAWSSDDRNALFRYCALFDEYIRHLGAGGRLFVAAEDWVNKTRGQMYFRVVLASADGDERVEEFGFFAGVSDAASFLDEAFPWATVDIDEEYYEDHEDVEPAAVFQDRDEPTGYVAIDGERPLGIRPYSSAGSGEVELYRFELPLNEIGRAFLAVDEAAKTVAGHPPPIVGLAIRGMTQASRERLEAES